MEAESIGYGHTTMHRSPSEQQR